VSQKNGIRDYMSQFDDITIQDRSADMRAIRLLGIWQYLPMVIGVIKRITSHLLTLAGNTTIIISEGIFVWMTVEVCFGVLVSQDNSVVVQDVDRSLMHKVVTESFLEFGGHKVVAGTGSRQDGEMNLEPEEIEEEWNYDEAQSTCSEVLAKGEEIQGTTFAIDIKEIPEIDQNGTANGEKGESTDIFGGDDTAHAETGQ
jgi:hypothetical protein